jgi:hypothetical protein
MSIHQVRRCAASKVSSGRSPTPGGFCGARASNAQRLPATRKILGQINPIARKINGILPGAGIRSSIVKAMSTTSRAGDDPLGLVISGNSTGRRERGSLQREGRRVLLAGTLSPGAACFAPGGWRRASRGCCRGSSFRSHTARRYFRAFRSRSVPGRGSRGVSELTAERWRAQSD